MCNNITSIAIIDVPLCASNAATSLRRSFFLSLEFTLPSSHSDRASRGQSAGCRDWPVTVVFILNLVSIAVDFGVNGRVTNWQPPSVNPVLGTTTGVFVLLCISFLAVLLVMFGLYIAIFTVPGALLWLALFGPFVLSIALLMSLATRTDANIKLGWTLGAAVGIPAIIVLISLVVVIGDGWRFFALLVQASSVAMNKSRGIFVVSVILGIQNLFIILAWTYLVNTMIPVHRKVTDCLRLTWYILTLLWIVQSIKNISHVTNCGSIASWYLVPGYSAKPRYRVLKSLFRALTTSLGSVLTGSLIVSIVDTVRSLFASRRPNCLTVCCLTVISHLMRIFNTYAFVYVATFGMGFLQAAMSVFSQFQRSGCVGLITEAITSNVTLCTTIMCGLLSWSVATFSLVIFFDHHPLFLSIGHSATGIAAVFGAFLASHFLVPLESSICTLYLCFVEFPDVLHVEHPELSEALNERNALTIG